MKKVLLTTFILFCHVTIVSAQSAAHSQDLMDLLVNNDCLQAREYHLSHKDSITPFVELFYQYRMNDFLNKPDSAAVYLEKLSDEFSEGVTKLEYINKLINLYNEIEDYEKLVDLYNKTEQLLQTQDFAQYDDTWKMEQIFAIEQYRSEAETKIHHSKMQVIGCGNEKSNIVDIQKEFYVTAVAEFNGIAKQAIINTGAGCYLMVSKDFADKCGFRELPSQTDSINVNGVMVRGTIAMADSVKIGNILITNVPVVVLYEKLASLLAEDSTMVSKEKLAKYAFLQSNECVMIGLSLLKKLGSIEFDWEKDKMRLKLKSDIPFSHKGPNMYLKNAGLYTDVLIDDRRYSGSLTPKDLENASLIEPNSEEIQLQNVVVMWPDKGKPVLTTSLYNDEGMGNKFLELLGNKVILDFVNMRIEVE